MGGAVVSRRRYRRRRNPSSSFTSEDFVVLAAGAVGIYAVYSLVIKPAQNIENAAGGAANDFVCFLRNPFCPTFY